MLNLSATQHPWILSSGAVPAGTVCPGGVVLWFLDATESQDEINRLQQKSGRLRTALVVLQFAVAIGLIVCTWVIFSQTRFVQTVDPCDPRALGSMFVSGSAT